MPVRLIETGTSGLRILLVEDNIILGEAVRDHVMAADHAVDWMKTVEGCPHLAAHRILRAHSSRSAASGWQRHRAAEGAAGGGYGNARHHPHGPRPDFRPDRGPEQRRRRLPRKPFDLGELGARMLAVIRRYGGNISPEIRFGDVTISPVDRRVFAGGVEVGLSGREWAVLDTLLARPGAIISKAQIEEALYAFGSEIESNTVEVYVSRLRKKLGRDHVVTGRGVGYKIGAPACHRTKRAVRA
jgi:two-component system, OmpR family, response regulator